ncbi:MAG: 5'-3' exonuclease H3TH domain-containing protein [Pseudomonadota bacterium]
MRSAANAPDQRDVPLRSGEHRADNQGGALNRRDDRLYLVDASIYLYNGLRRHGEAYSDHNGRAAGAVRGLVEALAQIAEAGATHVVCAFDGPRDRLLRRAAFPAYKAQRPAVLPSMAQQRLDARAAVAQLGYAALQHDAYEADDIIATLARRARAAKRAVVIVSADRDLVQVLRPGDEYWHLAAGQRKAYSTVQKGLRVTPERLPEVLALCGDAVDNVPGVPGINRGLATRLIRKWGSVEALYSHLDRGLASGVRGAPGLADTLLTHREQVDAARALVQLVDVPLDDDAASAPTTTASQVVNVCARLGLERAAADALVARAERVAA